MRYNQLFEDLQKLTGKNITDRVMMQVFGLKSPSTIVYKRTKNVDVTDDEINKIEQYFNVSLKNNSTDCISIDYIHLNPSCGKGTVVLQEPEVTPIKLGTQMIQSVLKITDPKCLKIFKASGDSMETIIEDGDMLLIDTTRLDFNNGGIFLLTINNDWFVKRLRRRLSGELDVISDNAKYPIETFNPDDNIEIVIKGRVIKNLSRGL